MLLLQSRALEQARRISSTPPIRPGQIGTLDGSSPRCACRSAENFADFQQDLLARVLEGQEHRGAGQRVAKRLRKGKAVPADAPELRSADPVPARDLGTGVRTSVNGWTVSFGRSRMVLPGACSATTGESSSHSLGISIRPDGPKAGLASECAFVNDWWRDEGRFVLLHDLTSCLTIGDATSFKMIGNEYEAYLHEIKSDPNRTVASKQRRRRMAEEAIRSGGPLPGDLPGRLVPLDIPYKTHLNLLRAAFDLAHERGVQGMKVPGGRALVATDIVRGYELWSEPELIDRTAAVHLQAVKRARMLGCRAPGLRAQR